MPTAIQLRELALARLKDAKILSRAERFDAARYLCGYAAELALKACVCRRLRVRHYPTGRAFLTHDFDELMLLAGVSEELTAQRHPDIYSNWLLVASWKPDWRYRPTGSATKPETDAMIKALEEPGKGVLPWLNRRR